MIFDTKIKTTVELLKLYEAKKPIQFLLLGDNMTLEAIVSVLTNK